jgi:hypothetical protein
MVLVMKIVADCSGRESLQSVQNLRRMRHLSWQDNCTIPGETYASWEANMPLIYIVLVLIVVGMALWLINNYIPMAGSIRTILNVVVVVAVCVWVLQAVGLWPYVVNYRVPR